MPLRWEPGVKASLSSLGFQLAGVFTLLLLMLGPTIARGETCGPPPAKAPLPKKFPDQWTRHHFKQDLIHAYLNNSWASLVGNSKLKSGVQIATYRCAQGLGLSNMASLVTEYNITCLFNGTWSNESHGECVHKPLSTMYPNYTTAWQSTDMAPNMNHNFQAENCIKNDKTECKTKIEKDPWWAVDLFYEYETTYVELHMVQHQATATVESIGSSNFIGHGYLKKPEGGSACENKSLPDKYDMGSDRSYLPFYCGLGEERVRYLVVSGTANMPLNMEWVAVWGWKCPKGFSGDACSPMCGADGCQHNGTCLERDVCVCKPGFTGSHCESTINPCDSSPCPGANNDCSPLLPTGYLCQCKLDWSGPNCTKQVETAGEDKGTTDSTTNPSIGGNEGITNSTTNRGNKTDNITKTGKGPERFLTAEKELVWGVGLGLSVLLAVIGIMVVAGRSKETNVEEDEEENIMSEDSGSDVSDSDG